MKVCKRCHRELELSNFSNRTDNKDGLHIYCKECMCKRNQNYAKNNSNKIKEAKRLYYQTNKETILKQMKETRLPGSRNEYLKEYYTKNKEKSKKNTQEYRKKNRDSCNEWMREYYKDPAKRIARSMYNRVRIAIFTQLAEKSQKTALLCGCTWEDLVQHIEKQFKPGMTWDNYGRYGGKWSIDHIKPCILYDLTDPQAQKECFHYTNLQPLWSCENSAKRDKY